jgi:DNA topoisomerase-2
MEEMDPWWNGFEGTVAKVDDYNYEIYGSYNIKGNKLIITELPVGESTSGYKELLEKLLEGDEAKKQPANSSAKGKATKGVKNKTSVAKKEKKDNPFLGYTENNTDEKIYFELSFESDYLDSAKDLDKVFHLCKKYSLNNMNLFDKNGTIKKYDNVLNIIDDYYEVRLDLYKKRQKYQLEILEFQLKLISYKVKFILLIVNKTLIINNKKKDLIEEELEKLDFPKIGKSKDDLDTSYNYLLSMPLYNLTSEKIEELKKQENEKQSEYDELNNMTPEKIWLKELDKLDKDYEKWYNRKLKQQNEGHKSLKLKKSKK